MIPSDFIKQFREAFGDNAELPIVFWYSSEANPPPVQSQKCCIQDLKKAREGVTITFDVEAISCMGGKLYTGLGEISMGVAQYMPIREKYKQRGELVAEFIHDLDLVKATKPYICFSRIDKIDHFDDIEGVIFFATPDILTGLISWVLFDTNLEGAVSVPFGSGCSSIVSQVVVENRKRGKRTFMGLFDPSTRLNIEPNILSLAIPMSRFKEMCETMCLCCLKDSFSWSKVRERINS